MEERASVYIYHTCTLFLLFAVVSVLESVLLIVRPQEKGPTLCQAFHFALSNIISS